MLDLGKYWVGRSVSHDANKAIEEYLEASFKNSYPVKITLYFDPSKPEVRYGFVHAHVDFAVPVLGKGE